MFDYNDNIYGPQEKVNFSEAYKLYNSEEIFKSIDININIKYIPYEQLKNNKVNYYVSNIDCKNNESNLNNCGISFLKDTIHQLEKIINQKIDLSFDFNEEFDLYTPFYIIKDIISIINEKNSTDYNLYFRGQSGGWNLIPTIFRDNYDDNFRKNYEEIYNDIAKKYPEKISYDKNHGSENRANNLAELQHYGLGTPLVDLTSNPFIALIFMTTKYNPTSSKPNPKLDIFFSKKSGKNHLFQKVSKNKDNLRIEAQKGAFLNFEKLFLDKESELLNGKDYIYKVSLNLICSEEKINSSEDKKLLPDFLEESTQETKNAIESVRTEVVKDIKNELNNFYYNENSLFPDFDMYLESINDKYKNNSNEINY